MKFQNVIREATVRDGLIDTMSGWKVHEYGKPKEVEEQLIEYSVTFKTGKSTTGDNMLVALLKHKEVVYSPRVLKRYDRKVVADTSKILSLKKFFEAAKETVNPELNKLFLHIYNLGKYKIDLSQTSDLFMKLLKIVNYFIAIKKPSFRMALYRVGGKQEHLRFDEDAKHLVNTLIERLVD